MSGWTQSTIAGIAPAVREAAVGTGWQVREGALSVLDGAAAFHASIFADTMNFRAKPLIWNGIYWDIMGTVFARPPRATRHWTSLSLPVPIRAQALVRGSGAATAAAALVNFATAEKARVTDIARLPKVRFAPDRDADFQMARVVERLASGDQEGAARLADGVVSGRTRSIFTHNTPGGSFFELALQKIATGAFEVSD